MYFPPQDGVKSPWLAARSQPNIQTKKRGAWTYKPSKHSFGLNGSSSVPPSFSPRTTLSPNTPVAKLTFSLPPLADILPVLGNWRVGICITLLKGGRVSLCSTRARCSILLRNNNTRLASLRTWHSTRRANLRRIIKLPVSYRDSTLRRGIKGLRRKSFDLLNNILIIHVWCTSLMFCTVAAKIVLLVGPFARVLF